MSSLTLYLRQGCHLCEDMLKDLRRLLEDRDVSLELIDVDRGASTRQAYGHRVPVLESSEGECLSEYFLDRTAVTRYLEASNNG